MIVAVIPIGKYETNLVSTTYTGRCFPSVSSAARDEPANAGWDDAAERRELQGVTLKPRRQDIGGAAQHPRKECCGQGLADQEPDRETDRGKAADAQGQGDPEPSSERVDVIEPEDLHHHMNTVSSPFNELDEAVLCPGSTALDKLNASLR